MTKISSLSRKIVSFLLLMAPVQILCQSDASGDPGKAAQAKSQEEFDQYLEIVTAPDPNTVIAKTKKFALQFPISELLTPVFQSEMHAFESLDDFDGMLEAGRKALAGNPDSTSTLLALAPAMATRAGGRPDRSQLLDQSESFVRRVLEIVETTRISRKISVEQWNQRKRYMQSQAHGVLGIVALQRNQNSRAIKEFSEAIELAPKPEGIQFLRLGLALSANGAKSEADKNFKRAVELGPDPVAAAAKRESVKLVP